MSTRHDITVTLNGEELVLTMLGSVGPLTYWLDEQTQRVYSYNLDAAQFVARGNVRELKLLPTNLQPK